MHVAVRVAVCVAVRVARHVAVCAVPAMARMASV